MWKKLFFCLCIFFQLGNQSAERIKINCCDIQKLIFRLECNFVDHLSIVKAGNIVRFQCLFTGPIISRFHGFLRPSNEQDLNDCIEKLNKRPKRIPSPFLNSIIFEKHIKDTRAVCKPQVKFLDIATTAASKLNLLEKIEWQTLEIENLHWKMEEKCHNINQITGKLRKINYLLLNFVSTFEKCEETTFVNATQLTKLTIIASSALVLPEYFLSHLKNLQKLTIVCRFTWVRVVLNSYMFWGLNNLETLILEWCYFKKLSVAHFNDLTSLRTLSLRNAAFNDVNWLSSKTLANHLTHLDSTNSLPINYTNYTYFDNYTNLKSLAISTSSKQTLWKKNGIIKICSNSSCQVIKDDDGVQCPYGCDCNYRIGEKSFKINCTKSEAGTMLTALPSLSNMTTIELILSDMNLNSLPNTSVTGYSNIQGLYVANNQLEEIKISQLPENLTFLDIRNNSFKSLSPEVRNYLARRNSTLIIQISGNPWNCECNTPDLMKFINSSEEMIKDYQKVRCNGMKVNFKLDKCKLQLTIYLVISLAILFVVTFVIVIWFRTSILMWLYEHGILMDCIRRTNVELSNRFDAFLAFSHKNLDLINEYVEQLENGKYEYKLCFYHRDWLIGESIPECILKSIDDSKRTIVLMTQEFLNSSWGSFEFRTAIKATSMDRSKRLIIIVYPEAEDLTKLDSELRIYMKYNTYLRRDDPLFWRKLFYSMPHKKISKSKKKAKRNKNHDTAA